MTAINNLFEYSGPNEFHVDPPLGPGPTTANLLVGNTFYKNNGDGGFCRHSLKKRQIKPG